MAGDNLLDEGGAGTWHTQYKHRSFRLTAVKRQVGKILAAIDFHKGICIFNIISHCKINAVTFQCVSLQEIFKCCPVIPGPFMYPPQCKIEMHGVLFTDAWLSEFFPDYQGSWIFRTGLGYYGYMVQ